MLIAPDLRCSYLGGKIVVTNWAATGSPGKTKKMNITGETLKLLVMSAGTAQDNTAARTTINTR
jgi:hypothetical protein